MISYDDNVETKYDFINNYLTVQHFVDLQCTAYMFDHTPYNYKCLHKTQRQNVLLLSQIKVNIFSEDAENLLQILLNIKLIFETIKFLEKRKMIKNIVCTL